MGNPSESSAPEASVAPLDAATVRAIKGKGVVATITPHFAVAVIVGLATAFLARRPDPVTADVGSEARRSSEAVTALRADFVQFKAETQLHNQQIERDINQLLARSNPVFAQPSIQPAAIAPAMNRALGQ